MRLGLTGFPGSAGWLRMGHSNDSEWLVTESYLPSLDQCGLASNSAVAGALGFLKKGNATLAKLG